MYQNCCVRCGSIDLYTKESGKNTGLYCSDCGAWQKWLGKEELRAFNNSKNMKDAKDSIYTDTQKEMTHDLFNEDLPTIERAFNEIGVKTRNENGSFRKFLDVFCDLVEKWNESAETK